jgi:ABC-type branched-subunit amino acid transport system substrate-binding protein
VDSVCVAAPGCTSHAECFDKLGVPGICRAFDRTCAPLFSAECKEADMDDRSLKAIKDDAGTIVLGVLAPLTSDQASTGRAIFNASLVAVDEITNAKNGIPSPTAGGRSRPLAFVPCDQINDEAAATDHLANTLKVPAIIGPQFSGTLKRIYGTTLAAHTLLFSPSATASDIAGLSDNNLVWRTAPPDVLQAKAIAGLIATRVEPQVRAELTDGATAQLKLAVMHKSDSYGTGLETDIRGVVQINGVALSSTNPNYQPFNYGDPDSDGAGLDARIDASVASVVTQAPHIVIIVGTVEAATKVLPKLEAAWKEPAYRPRYIVTDGVQAPELVTAAPGGSELAKRILGTVPGTQSTQYADFLQRYRSDSRFSTSSPDVFGTAGGYDATYMLAYSILAAGDQPLTGEILAQGFGKLVSGDPIDLGSADSLNKAFDIINQGGSININGASGPLDFDLKTGDATSDIQIWCISSQSKIINTGEFLGASGSLAGTFSCP